MDSWRKKSSINSKDMERLYTKLAQINDRSDIANLPALFAAKDLEFGDFEQAAWIFSNKCAHADNPSLIGDEKTLLFFEYFRLQSEESSLVSPGSTIPTSTIALLNSRVARYRRPSVGRNQTN
jgi:hypothetical protein